MRLLVTGASGNLGTALLERLAASHELGEVEVLAVSRRRPPSVPPYDRVSRWVELDLASGPVDELTGLLQGVDAVVHLAWGFQPSHDLGYLADVALTGMGAVLAAAARTNVAHVVHLSSVGAYAPHPGVWEHFPPFVDESWPVTGVPQLSYSLQKAAVERLLDRFEGEHPGTLVSRLRPGIVLQGEALSALMRYGLPALLPLPVVRSLPFLLLPRDLAFQVVHAGDVADALVRVLERRVGGAFNLASEPVVTPALLSEVSGRPVREVPRGLVKAAAVSAWRLRLSPLDPGWLDLGLYSPLMAASRARDLLGWVPSRSAKEVLEEIFAASYEPGAGSSAPLRPRSVLAGLSSALRRGGVASRRLP